MDIILNNVHQYTVNGKIICNILEWINVELDIRFKSFTLLYATYVQYI